MAIIIETCPVCGHDLHSEVICTYPPIPREVCYNCGWSLEGKQEEIVRVPFGNSNLIIDDLVDCTNLKSEDCTLLGNNCTITTGVINANELKQGF